jgi:hypothetical protein
MKTFNMLPLKGDSPLKDGFQEQIKNIKQFLQIK